MKIEILEEAQEDLIYHRCLSKRFPFAVYYSLDRELVRVFAVLDCRRNPSWIRARLKEGG